MIISPCVSVAGVHVVALIIAALIVVLVAMVAVLFVRIEFISMKEQIKFYTGDVPEEQSDRNIMRYIVVELIKKNLVTSFSSSICVRFDVAIFGA